MIIILLITKIFDKIMVIITIIGNYIPRALQRTQRFYITVTVHIRQCNHVAAANQRQLRHSNTQSRTYGLGNRWLSHFKRTVEIEEFSI